jgi:D-alanyl-D-alanine carboxypeptidase
MCGVRCGASRWLRVIALGLLTIVTIVTVTSDAADARRRHRRHHHHRHHHVVRYNPPSASIVVDANSGKVLEASNADAPRHPASLTKIMTLYLLFERLQAGKMTLATKMKVSAHAAAQSPTKLDLDAGDTINVDDAIKAMVTRSANDVAVVVAEAIAGDEHEFAKLMTRTAHALGMKRTTYVNASGLPNDEQVTTARDQATLARAIQERFPKYYKYFSTRVFTYDGDVMRNHNHLLGSVDGVDGIKTGFTRASGFNLVTSVRRDHRHIISVVFGGRSSGSRDAEMRALIGKYIKVASTKRTATMVAEVRKPAPAPVKRYALASAPSHARPASQVEPVQHPQPGSTDPIRPLLVKTITVRPGAMKIGMHSPLAMALPNADIASIKKVPAEADADKTATLPPAPAREVAATKAPTVAPVASTPATEPEPTKIATVAEKTTEPTAKPAPHKVTHSGWIIQVGAFTDESEAKNHLTSARSRAKRLLADADPFTESVVKGDTTWYRARFAGLDKNQAYAACRYLKRNDFGCFAIKN